MSEQKRWENRIIRTGMAPVDQIQFSGKNWRIHPKAQQDALAGVLSEVGVVQHVIINERTGNLVDGHLRVTLADRNGETEIPAVWVNLSDEEEALVLATIDPLAAMAATDREQLSALLHEVSTGDAAVQAMLDQLAQDAGIVPVGAPPDLTPGPDGYKEQYGVIVICGDEVEQERVYEALKGEGYTVRVVTT